MAGTALVTIGENQWSVNIANTLEELAAGLAGVISIPAGTGMLFVLPTSQVVTVDTTQMNFPLDIIFIAEGLVIDVAHNIQPGYLVTEETPCDAFIEVNAGEAVGVEVGNVVTTVTIQQPTPGFDFSSIIGFVIPLVMVGFVISTLAEMLFSLVFGSGSNKKKNNPGKIRPSSKSIISSSPKLELIYSERKREIPEEIEYFPDSAEFLTQTIIDIGWKEKIDVAFRDRMTKVGSS